MIKKILTNKKLYLALAALIIAGAAFLYIFDSLLMPAYTNYNEGITIPDVTQVSLDEAESILSSYGLRFEVSDRRANSAYPANYVIDQNPSPDNIVKPNRKIYLTVNTAVKPQVEVPNLENISLRNAQLQLQNYGLEMGSISYESSRFKSVILRQSVPEGTTVDKGTAVDLVVGDGLGNRMVEIPEIIGLPLPEAQLKLREVGLRLGPAIFRPSRNVAPNVVLDYSPKQDEIIEGETLTLVISERFEAVEQNESGAVIDTTEAAQSIPPDSLNNQSPDN